MGHGARTASVSVCREATQRHCPPPALKLGTLLLFVLFVLFYDAPCEGLQLGIHRGANTPTVRLPVNLAVRPYNLVLINVGIVRAILITAVLVRTGGKGGRGGGHQSIRSDMRDKERVLREYARERVTGVAPGHCQGFAAPVWYSGGCTLC